MHETRSRHVRTCALAVAVAIALVASALGPASAQTLQYDLGIDFPEFVVLWYYDSVEIDVTGQDLTQLLVGSTPAADAGAQSLPGSFSGSTVTVDAGIDAAADGDLLTDPSTPIWLTVTDGWAIRSVSYSGQTQVSIRVKKKNANNPQGNKIVGREALVGSGGTIGSSVVLPSTGFGGMRWGDIYLEVDISRAETSGTYDGIEVQIVAENI